MRIAILISGTGSNMKALVERISQLEGKAEIGLIAANTHKAAGIDWAEQNGLTTWTPQASGADKYAEADLIQSLQDHKIDLVCLAGFMRLVSKDFLSHWPNRVLNIHPALLPAYPGLDTHARALADGQAWHGCSVHYVDEGMDTGPIIAQAKVPVLPDDTPERLAERVLVQEHILYPQVVEDLLAANAEHS